MLSNEDAKLLSEAPFRLPADLRQRLARLGFLVASKKDEIADMLHFYRRDSSDPRFLSLTVSPTLACNLRCTYCFQTGRRVAKMSRADEEEIVRFVGRNLDGKHSLDVTWFGGEPLLEVGTVDRLSKRLIRMCSFRGVAYRAGIFTNGLLLIDGVAWRLAGLQIHGIRLTLDGPPNVHNRMRPDKKGATTFEAVFSGVKIACRHFPSVVLGIIVGRANCRQVPELLELLAREHLTQLHLIFSRKQPRERPGRNEPRDSLSVPEYAEEETRLIRTAHKLGLRCNGAPFEHPGVGRALPCCSVDRNHYSVEPGGHVHRCRYSIGAPDEVCGRLIDGDFCATSTDLVWEQYSPFDGECSRCAYLPLCFGGCVKHRLWDSGEDPKFKEKHVCVSRRFNLAELLRCEHEQACGSVDFTNV